MLYRDDGGIHQQPWAKGSEGRHWFRVPTRFSCFLHLYSGEAKLATNNWESETRCPKGARKHSSCLDRTQP